MTPLFKPMSSDRQTKDTNADKTTNCSEIECSENLCLSDSSCSKDSVSESQLSTSESIETHRNCSDFDPKPSESSNTPEIPKENSFDYGTRSSAVIDGTITDDKLSFTIKWEKSFTWAYYNSYHAS